MGRKETKTLTRLELEIMQVLWARGACTVAEVQRDLRGELAYTTVQTMLNVLWRKEKVKRAQEGRAFRYEAVVSRERASGSAVRDLVSRMFGGSSEALLMAMVDTRQISAEELARLAAKLKTVDAQGNVERGSGARDQKERS
jgi:predicted transcriptional regulator